jgi:histidine triad (HIT) family protein
MPAPEPHDPTCLFCRIVDGDVPGHIVWRDEQTCAFLDIRPLFHGHVLVVPTRHVVTLPDLAPEQVAPFFTSVQSTAVAVRDAMGAQGTFVAMNNVVSQSVAHLHVHVVPRTKGDGLRGFFWPRTKYRDDDQAIAVAASIAGAYRAI